MKTDRSKADDLFRLCLSSEAPTIKRKTEKTTKPHQEKKTTKVQNDKNKTATYVQWNLQGGKKQK